MGFYSRVVFPRLCNLALGGPAFSRLRRELLADADGAILEIGLGTGLNLPHYPALVRRIVAVDPNPGMERGALRRAAAAGIEVDHRRVGGEALPFADATFDRVVSAWTLCSIPDVDRALAEIFRVLRPGGRFLFLEHGLAADPGVRRWQRRLNTIEGMLADGCRLDRDIAAIVRRPPFGGVEVDRFEMPRLPRTHGTMYRGAASK